ncbi:MarR family transcriptional regulator [Streptomyces sp. NPDC059445]|uniref:MarR family transcriptional regulator n=1 Tax=Streptomyces sp. NPDC059445 TaxID=3346832 RepID=UPI0036ACD763
MSGIRDSLGRVGYDLLSHALSECQNTRATGKLRVSGKPGGVFHLRDGAVVAVESPGAPGAEARLLRSGRVSGEQWAELLRESGGTRWPEAGLIAHGYAGAAQLRVVCMMAMQDAAFAVVAGDVEACDPLDAAFEPYAPVALGEAPGRLLQDAARKLAAVAALPRPVRPDRERPVPAAVPDEIREQLPPPHKELLAQADGRRTARDIAFATGLGAYTVTVGMARMLGEGLLELPAESDSAVRVTVRDLPTGALRQRPAGAPPALDPEVFSALSSVVAAGEETARDPAPPDPAASDPAGPDPAAPEHRPDPGPPPPAIAPALPRREPGAHAPSLPRREPGASGIAETLAPERAGASWKGFFRLRHRIWTPDSGT